MTTAGAKADVTAVRTLSGWASHAPSASFCAIVDRVGGRVVTACNGSWSERDDGDRALVSYQLMDDSVRCAACVRELRPMPTAVEQGLVELRDATALGPDSNPPFDLSDEQITTVGGEG